MKVELCSSLKFHPSLHRQRVYTSQSPTACLPRVRKPSNPSPFSPSSRLISIVGKATYTPRIHGFFSVFGALGEIQSSTSGYRGPGSEQPSSTGRDKESERRCAGAE
ncbi:uncharacterized protein LACBIDRAFT_299315 [Laccaria bicolor S238N-H82]|uniref:Predicted protein n=1 Tax=Laccaria bicolor (strain S238N-H82 / ATCC MYA-4686) TaxID=486041 RepID=B0DEG8_LACBS|nr:uncharacterized protein LACBIDRAFT_299315 [Laccaria bicolor S238N-H82]EDR06932.1 predicted protein [Laccaria bicolor S238N-H82]|eukprot:XP_001882305.1 predicted protein [Laccaria bicolor S238N-H82]